MTTPHLKLARYDADPADEAPTAHDGPSTGPSAARIAESLRRRRDPGDLVFDRLLPRPLEAVSRMYWTPLEVAIRVAEWVDHFGIRTMVDIGSGAGKFAVAVALCSSVEVVGIEQRPRLVRTARHLARLFRLEGQVQFLNATFGEDPLPAADAYYLYNSFGENLFDPEEHLDADVELSVERYARDLQSLVDVLERAPVGTFVFTYNGVGRTLPPSYEDVKVARDLRNILRASRKNR